MNVRILPDGKLFTSRIPYIDTVQYYWRKICADGQLILSVTFLTLIYLKYFNLTNPVQMLQHKNHEINNVLIFMTLYGSSDWFSGYQVCQYFDDEQGHTKTIHFMHPGVSFNHYSYRESVDKHNGWRMYPIAI